MGFHCRFGLTCGCERVMASAPCRAEIVDSGIFPDWAWGMIETMSGSAKGDEKLNCSALYPGAGALISDRRDRDILFPSPGW